MHLELLEERRVLAALIGTGFDVVDEQPPQFTSFPADLFINAQSEDGAIVVYEFPTAEDDEDPNPTVACQPSSGTLFPVGTTEVVCTATDISGNSDQIGFVVDVAPLSFDWGDAPDPTYATLGSSDGPNHVITDLTLGASIDAEFDGQPNATATGDDSVELADEDGVNFPFQFVPGTATAVRVTASAPGVLDYFFDFNGNGVFGDVASEAFSFAHPGGSEFLVPVTVPSDAAVGGTFARFRLSTAGGLGPGGPAADGEVEDYAVTIEAGSDTQPPVFDSTADISLAATQPDGTIFDQTLVTATDNVDPNPHIACDPPFGSLLTIGATTVSCMATDSSGNSSAANFQFLVESATETNLAGSGQAHSEVQPSLALNYIIATVGTFPSEILSASESAAEGQDPFLGEIRLFAGNFAPRGWAFASGQLLDIASNSALFSILGTTYGGNGETTFALPNLNRRVPIGPRRGPGLSNYQLGAAAGNEDVSLTAAQLANHRHGLPETDNVTGATGGSQSHDNLQPSLAINYIIATQGLFPSRDLTADESLSAASEPYLAEVAMFAGNFAPRGWALADGAILPINQYQSLFSLLGTMYGGDGRTTFALPDLRGRAVVGQGNGPGLMPRTFGQRFGSERVTVTAPQVGSHDHDLPGTGVTDPTGGAAHENVQPSLVMGYIIATDGTYPSRDLKAGVAGEASLSSNPFLGEVNLFAGNFAPRGWAFAEGQLLSIASNTALFSLLGTTYGGDGRTTFGLPDLRGRVAVGADSGVFERRLGSKFGQETVTLTEAQLPSHRHGLHVAYNDAAGAEFNTATPIDVLDNDQGADGESLTISAAGDANHGTVAIDDGQILYTPETDYFGTDSFTYSMTGNNGNVATGTVHVVVHPPRVIRTSPFVSSVDLRLNFDPDFDVLNLYHGLQGDGAAPDIRVVGDQTGPVAGSLVWEPEFRTLTFVRTGGPWLPDIYSVHMSSRADGVVTDSGILLDGDQDESPGGDFLQTFVVELSNDRVLSLPDFARGPGQRIHLPAEDQNAYIPVMIDEGEGVGEFEFVLFYDPVLLAIENVLEGASLNDRWTVDVADLSEPGAAVIHAAGPALGPGPRELIRFAAAVPEDAPAGAAGLLLFGDLFVRDGNGLLLETLGDDAVQSVGLLGDASGDGTYSGLDASLISRVAVGLDAGFDSFRRTDPKIVGDVTRDGTMSALDAAFVARKAVGLEQPEIPDPPPPNNLATIKSAPIESLLTAWSLAAIATFDEFDTALSQSPETVISTDKFYADWLVPSKAAKNLLVRDAAILDAAESAASKLTIRAERDSESCEGDLFQLLAEDRVL